MSALPVGRCLRTVFYIKFETNIWNRITEVEISFFTYLRSSIAQLVEQLAVDGDESNERLELAKKDKRAYLDRRDYLIDAVAKRR